MPERDRTRFTRREFLAASAASTLVGMEALYSEALSPQVRIYALSWGLGWGLHENDADSTFWH
jgi:hypothetical protein